MSKSDPPPSPIFYLDENLGGMKVYSALTQAGISTQLHSAHFARGTPDDQWLPVVGQNGWVLLTQDKGIRRHKNEISALREHKVCAFIVAAKGLRGEEIGQLIVDAMPKILRILKHTQPPLVALISRNNVVELKEGEPRFGKKNSKAEN